LIFNLHIAVAEDSVDVDAVDGAAALVVVVVVAAAADVEAFGDTYPSAFVAPVASDAFVASGFDALE
jgi:hypothetical protein